MKKHPDVVAWEKWKAKNRSPFGALDPSILINPYYMNFLENRLWEAFMEGCKAGRKSTKPNRAKVRKGGRK